MVSLYCVLLYVLTVCTYGQQYRLPKTIIPTNYAITLHPNFNTSTFKGWMNITLEIKPQHFNNSNLTELFVIQFNQGATINISSIEIQINGILIPFQSQFPDIETQINTVTFPVTNSFIINNTVTGIPRLNIIYDGILKTESPYTGFYISQYEYNSMTIRNAVTQFAAIDARWAFPCWDEPDFKATFNISYIAPVNAATISNAPIREITMNVSNDCVYTTHDGNTSSLCKHVSFEETPTMSTYIVFFGIGDYQSLSMTDSDGTSQTIYFQWGYDPIQYAQYGLNDTALNLPFFSQLLDHPYPMPKMDTISVSLFAFGAMENYGAITYTTNSILLDPEVASFNTLNSVSRIISHEIAHQWWGNLVTHRWWDHIWLNEGFATYFQYIGINYTHPELNPWDHFYVSAMNGVMLNTDSSIFVPPIVRTLLTPQDIGGVYNGIVYQKAGSVLHGLRNYCKLLLGDESAGDDLFYGSLINYLTEWQGDNAVSQDLFDQFDLYLNNGDTIISDFMNTWMYNAGYPVLYVFMEEIDDDFLRITLKQERFVKEGPKFYEDNEERDNPYYDQDKADEFKKQIWQIPIQYETYQGVEYDVDDSLVNKLLITKNITFTIQRSIDFDNDDREFYIFNPSQEHYFRVIYDDYSFDLIFKNFKSFTDLNQFNIISDLDEGMLSGYFSPIKYLDFVSSAWNRDNYDIYIDDPLLLMHDIIIDSLLRIDSILCGSIENTNNEIRNNFRKYARDFLSPILEDLNGWNSEDDDSENIKSLRRDLLNAMIIFEDADIIELGKNILMNAIYENGTSLYIDFDMIDTQLLQQLFSAAFSTLEDDVYDTIINIFLNDDLNSIRVSILNSFGFVYQNEDMTTKTLDLLLNNNDDITDSQIINGLNSFKSCYGRDMVWDRLMENDAEKWKYLYSISQNAMISYVDTVESMERYNEIYSFYFDDGDIYNLTNGASNFRINETLEDIYINIQWINTNYDELNDYFSTSDDDDWWSKSENIFLVVFLSLAGVVIILVVIYCFMKKKKGRINLQPNFVGNKKGNYAEMADAGYGATNENDRTLK